MTTFQKRFLQAKDLSELRWIDIAKKSGLSKASISQYKNGVHIPDYDALYKLSKALGLSMEWLSGADVPIVSEDVKLLNRYRRLNDAGKAEFMRILDTLLTVEKYKR